MLVVARDIASSKYSAIHSAPHSAVSGPVDIHVAYIAFLQHSSFRSDVGPQVGLEGDIDFDLVLTTTV
jgi:hypothetical protein